MTNTNASPRPGIRSALAVQPFRQYFYANVFSTFGLWVMRFLVGWTAWALTESAFLVGVVSATMLLPTFLLSPIFGVLTDRINLRTGVMITTGVQVIVGLAAGLGSYAGWLTIEWLLVLALVKGIISAAHHPMRLSLMPRLIDRNLLPSAIGLSAIIFNSSRIIGPAVGAGLLAFASAGFAFVASAVLFLASTLMLTRLPTLLRTERAKDETVLHDLLAGLRFAATDPSIRLILVLAMMNGFLGRTVLELLPALSGQLLAGTANTLALLTALAGVGSIMGGLVMSRQSGNERRLVAMVMAALFASALLLLPVLWLQELVTVSAIILLLSVAMTITGTGCQALTQLVVPEHYRGRVLSLWTVITMGTPAIGAFIMGGLADWLGFGPALAGFSVVALAIVIWLFPKRWAIV